MSYKIKLEIFEGPLDLLLYLVKRDHLNIYDIPIAQITEEYLRYLELMRFLDLKVAGEFLVMASTLMEIKSKMLLPAEETPVEEQVSDPRQELVNQLLEYEKFKRIAEELRQKEIQRQNVFKRPVPLEMEKTQEVYFEASLFDLLSAFSEVLKELPANLFYEVIKDEFTVEEKIHDILHMLLEKPIILLSELFNSAKDKLEIIVTFLAVLELIRLKEIKAVQRKLFSEIEIIRNTENILPYGARKT
ncbi:MAG: segregation/condensation protein A [Candidatus Omnitrophica bacterium]|nr:segregation/condensation protein A [Candidatus Omnitrophota bacterium]